MSNEASMQKTDKASEQVLLDKFLADNQLFLGPDPEIDRKSVV